jgi:hypothetical protein
MAAETRIKWEMEADYLQACSCDYGCPCEFQAPPTQGFCEGIGAYHIRQGHYGDVSLDGLGWAFVVHFPGAMHEGNGTGVIFIDERASAQQREALLKITSGEAGGIPFDILQAVIPKWLSPQYVPFRFNLNGKNSSVQIGDAGAIAVEPIKNPVTGEPEGVRIEHETGFIFKGAEVVSARECRVSVEGLGFSHPNKAGFVAQTRYAN